MRLQIYSVGDGCNACKALIKWLDKNKINYEVIIVTDYDNQAGAPSIES